MIENYTFENHTHNFAVWTAARAVNRNFTTTAKVKDAIDASSLREFAKAKTGIDRKNFDRLHRIWSHELMQNLSRSTQVKVSYGRVAKIISIYLKTSVIIRTNGNGANCAVIHPPIDGILLKSISEVSGLNHLSKEKWTQLTEERYWELVDEIENKIGLLDWRLEYFWKPNRD